MESDLRFELLAFFSWTSFFFWFLPVLVQFNHRSGPNSKTERIAKHLRR
jgi:hypothetical protein